MPEVPAAAWVVWLVVTIVSFAVLEIVALVSRRRGDTLSEYIRRWLGVDPPNPRRRVAIPAFLAVLVGFVAWSAPHVVVGWP